MHWRWVLEYPLNAFRQIGRKIHLHRAEEWDENLVRKSSYRLCQEIASKRYVYKRPYRKPTQVGEESILRCSREFWLRNSAK